MWSSDAAPAQRHQLELPATVRGVQTALPVKVDERETTPPPPPPLDLTPLLEALEQARGEQTELVEKVLQEIDTECRALVFECVERLVGRAVAEGACELEVPLREMIERARTRLHGDPLLVRMHPEDMEEAQIALEDSPLPALEWRADPALSRGDLVVEGGGLVWLRSIAADLSQVRQRLRGGSS